MNDQDKKDVSSFRQQLWRTIRENAEDLNSQQVITALEIISEDVYEAGIDTAYNLAKIEDSEFAGEAFDLTWMAVLAVKLKKMKQEKRL